MELLKSEYQEKIIFLSFFSYFFNFIFFLISDRYVIVGSHHSRLKGFGGQGWASSTAVITALLQALMAKVKRGWRPDRTLLFCSWGGTALGNVGSYEWAEVKQLGGGLTAVRIASAESMETM